MRLTASLAPRAGAVTATLGAVAAFALLAAPAGGAPPSAARSGTLASASGLYISGAGYGHGVGMSQYGAAGYALHGANYRQILLDYYSQTAIGQVSPRHTVTVLLRPAGTPQFSGATRIRGSTRALSAGVVYEVQPAGPKLRLIASGRTVGVFAAPLAVSGRGPLNLVGQGRYDGALVFRPSARGQGVTTVNAVALDAYVRGVVAAEMPSDWPAQALEAQAVAARSYAFASRPVSPYFDLYDNTRSQMYGGVTAQTRATDAAVAATSGQVVEFDGIPVVTYFFSSSGGETESVQNVFSLAPEPWLVGRPDPYDDSLGNPYYRWKLHLTLPAARARLGHLVKGALRGIRVLQRGVSPRIVRAQVVGTSGSSLVSGLRLWKLLQTPSSWMAFTTVTTRGVITSAAPFPQPVPAATPPPAAPTSTSTSATTTTTTTTPATGGGGLAQVKAEQAASAITGATSAIARARARSRKRIVIAGSVFPARPGARVQIQHRAGGSWATVSTVKLSPSGHYAARVARPGSYRIRYRGITGPAVTVR